MTMEEIEVKVRQQLSKKRYVHTQGVAYTASCMAMVFDVSLDDAYLAGLLHDIAKHYSDKKKVSLCKKYKMEVTSMEERRPELLHAKLGAYLAKETYGIENEDICNAIHFHTTGRSNMTTLEKIIYLADYIEYHRKELKNMKEIRKACFEDLDLAMFLCLQNTISYLETNNQEIDKLSLDAYEFYSKKRS